MQHLIEKHISKKSKTMFIVFSFLLFKNDSITAPPVPFGSAQGTILSSRYKPLGERSLTQGK